MANFKQTEIGLIPEDWEVVRLGEVAEVIRGVSWRKEEASKERKGVAVLTIPNIEKGKVNYEFNYYLNKEISPQKFVKPKDIVFVASSGSLENIGRNTMIKFLPFDDKIAFASFVAVLRTKQNLIIPEFLYFLINSYWIDFSAFTKRAADGKFNFQLRDFEENALIPLPPLSEQQKIAKVLDKIQQAIEIQDRIIEETKNLKKSLMKKLFTEGLYGEEPKETEIGIIPKSWEVLRLGEIGKLEYGYTASSKEKNTGIKYLRITDIKDDGSILWNDVPYCDINDDRFGKYQLKNGDILFARIGATTGKTCFIENPPKSIFASYLIRLRMIKSEIYDKFVYYYTQTSLYWNQLKANKEGKLKKGISANILKSFLIPLPPLEEQKQIAHILSIVDKKIKIEQRKKIVLKELFKTMLYKLMKGELRLKEIEI
jgi:type I restriction enzyme S subunit